MKKVFLLIILLCICITGYAQSYDQEKVSLSRFIERMYNASPFEGCRIVDDYNNSYLLSVVELDASKYKTRSVMNRVAQVKSQRNAGEFFNGTQSYSEITIKTPESEEKGGGNMSEAYEIIRTNSTGFVQQMELLSTFDTSDGTAVVLFYKKINN